MKKDKDLENGVKQSGLTKKSTNAECHTGLDPVSGWSTQNTRSWLKAAMTERLFGQPLKEGIDYYLEGGLMVFTSAYHLKRGYCCKNKCRHCPFGLGEKITSSKNPE